MGRKINIDIISRCFNSITPRWIVLTIDMMLVFMSCVFALYIEHNNDIININLFHHKLIQTAVVLLVFMVMSRITKSYWGIIRYTGFEDSHRLFKMVSFSCIVLVLINWGFRLMGYGVLFNILEIVELGIFSFTFILLERMTIKSLYRRVADEKKIRKRVIILGAGVNTMMAANALKHEADSEYKPVALLSLDKLRSGTKVGGVPVETYNPDHIADIFKKYDCHTLIFLSSQIDVMKNGMADIFLEHDIELLLLSQLEQYDGDKEKKDVSSHINNINIEDLLGREPISTDNHNIISNINGVVALVTGAAGSIGSEIVRQLLLYKAKSVIIIDQAETPMHTLQLELNQRYPYADIHYIVADVRNAHRMRMVFEQFKPNYVFHAAAYKHVPMMEINPTEALLTNVGGTRILADLAVEYKVKKFVMISTDKAVNPTNIMGCSKRIAEIYVQALYSHLSAKDVNVTKFITTRFGNVLGSNGSVVPLFKEQIAKGGPITVTHRDIIRYFMTIPEACNLVLEASCMGQGGEIFIFDMGHPVKIYDLAKRMIRLAGLTPNVDIKIEETGLRAGEKLYEELLNNKEITQPTYHKKIMIAQVDSYKYDDATMHIKEMLQLAQSGDTIEMVRCMKRLVREYKSNNSVFEELDHEEQLQQVV